ncbi:MAG TPA: FUSC family protein, partial [Solirubrobacteraceae bacterium]|nr:FUSC family protein [Solirubrobacteraceae bacterium]
ERRWAQRWLGAPVERLSLERRRELIEAAAARGRVSSRGARARLRENWLPIVQTAAAAALAWLLANVVFGHANPVFAPIAAIVSLGATRGQRARRAVELMLGVAVGITAGDLLTTLIGVGVWQLAVIVGLAMAAAVSLGAGLLMLSEAGVSATLVATVQATTSGFPPARLVDVLLGGAVALVFSQLLFPVHPVKLVRSAAEGMVRELADTLRAIADALDRRDRDQAEEVLERARRISAAWGRFEQALDTGGEAARFAPARRRQRGSLGVYRDIGRPLDLIVGDVTVLARGAVRALRLGDPIPPRLSAALVSLAGATDALAARIGSVEDHPEVSAPALEAVVSATELALTGQSLSLSVLIAYTQATAADLLRALGVDRDPAHERVGQAAQTATERVAQEPALR